MKLHDQEDQQITAINRSEKNLESLNDINLPKKLISLNIELNKISHLGRIPKSLLYLNASSNKIKSLVSLPNLPLLEELDLSFNSIELITNLRTPKLKTLNLSNNKIRLVEGFQNCRNLKSIDLSHNEVMKIKDIPSYNKVGF